VHNLFSSARNKEVNNDVTELIQFCKDLESLSTYFDLLQTVSIGTKDLEMIFIGIDNHGRTILFGCALFRNETFAAFSWLMEDVT
ncbi:hypothetical protein V2J09_020911, partial [Rumex salicifolius]